MPKPLPKPEVTNPRGIPQAPFLQSVEEYASTEKEVSEVLSQLQEMLKKYQFMEVATKQRQANLDEQIPNLQQTLDSIKFLQTQSKPFDSRFNLDETVYAKAKIYPVSTVWLWLGANVMLEYPLSEALDLTAEKLDTARTGSSDCAEDLEFLRENITTMEVNTARMINYQVALRKSAKA